MKQISATKVSLLLQCPRPFQDEIAWAKEEPGEAAIYGTQIHKLLADQTSYEEASFVTGETIPDLRSHVESIQAVEADFLAGNNPWGTVYRVHAREKSYCDWAGPNDRVYLDEKTHTYRVEGPNGEDYGDRPEGLFGTADLVAVSDGAPALILDYKTGENVPPTADTLQMRTLALLDADGYRRRRVAILHAPKGQPPRIYTDEYSSGLLCCTEEDIIDAKNLARTDGFAMRVGVECKYCPARTSCPAYAGLDVVEANTVLAKVSGTDLLALDISPGEMHLFIQRLERLIEQAKTRIRAEVLSGVVVERPDGKTLVPNQVSKESISKASILRALGPEKGQALLDELREAGALTQISYTEVRAK